jgi:hypothetical protein
MPIHNTHDTDMALDHFSTEEYVTSSVLARQGVFDSPLH